MPFEILLQVLWEDIIIGIVEHLSDGAEQIWFELLMVGIHGRTKQG